MRNPEEIVNRRHGAFMVELITNNLSRNIGSLPCGCILLSDAADYGHSAMLPPDR